MSSLREEAKMAAPMISKNLVMSKTKGTSRLAADSARVMC